MRDTDEADTAAARRRAARGRPEDARRVLVAEDEQDVAELIRHHLTKGGYDVVVARTGAEALKRARGDRPGLILLDIMIPQMNGREVCRCLKREPETADIPVIMVSGRVEEGDKVLGFELGADDYVTKPFSPRELLGRIRAVARRRESGEATGRRARLTVGALEIDRERFEVTVGGRPVDPTPVSPRRPAGPRLGAGWVRRAPHRRRSRGATAEQVPGGQGRAAGRRDGPRRRLPVPRAAGATFVTELLRLPDRTEI